MTYKQLKKHYKTQRAIAEALGIDPRNVANWASRGVPVAMQQKIEQLTEGKLRASK